MAEWRIARGWSEAELAARLRTLDELPRNFEERTQDEMTAARGWVAYGSEAVVAREALGAPVPEGPFTRAAAAVREYRFSDPSIVVGHYDPGVPLERRRMLLELRVTALRYLCGVAVGAVQDEDDEGATTFGFRYDTLAGHIERGSEWFLLTKSHATGEVRFAIRARWRPGDFPNWWSRVGFRWLGPRYQERWHRRAHRRLEALARGAETAPLRRRGRLRHEGPDIIFHRERQAHG